MDTLLHQSRSMCPFLKKTSPATLRALSTRTTRNASPGGGTMSNLQVLARRCPIMGKALAVQSARLSTSAVARIGSGAKMHMGKAKLHTTRVAEAMAVDAGLFRQNNGIVHIPAILPAMSRQI